MLQTRPSPDVKPHQCITIQYSYRRNCCNHTERYLVSGNLLLADSPMLCADLLQPKAQHRQSPLTDPHLVQRGNKTQNRDRPINCDQPQVCGAVDCAWINLSIKCEGESYYYKCKYVVWLCKTPIIYPMLLLFLFAENNNKKKRILNFTEDIYPQAMVSCFSSFNVFFMFQGSFVNSLQWLHCDYRGPY